MSAVAEWIRPWFPAGFAGHIYRDCPGLLKWGLEPAEGAGWLDPAAAVKPFYTCHSCLKRHDPKIAAKLADDDDWYLYE